MPGQEDVISEELFLHEETVMIAELLNPEQYLFTPRAISVLIVGAGIVCLGVFVLVRERWSSIGIRFWLFTLTAGLWLLSFGMAYASRHEAVASRWFFMGEIGVVFLPPAIFSANISILQKERELRLPMWIFVAAAVLFCGFLLSTDLFLNGLYRHAWGWYPRYGIIGALFIGYFGVAAASSRRMYSRAYRSSAYPRNRLRLRGITIGAYIGYLAALDFVASLGPPLYPVGFLPIAAYLFITSWVILRYRFVDITPALAANRILETMQGAVIVVDLEGKIRVVNRVVQEMLGYEKSELLGNDITVVLDLPPALQEHIKGEKHTASREMIWSGKNGQRFEMSVSASLLTDSRDETPVGLVYVAHDITERKRSEEQLRRYAAELKQSNDDVLSFSYIVSHDLRVPLINIKGFALELRTALNALKTALGNGSRPLSEKERKKLTDILREDGEEAIQFIESSAQRMDGQISAILHLSRLGHREMKPEPIDTSALVQSILNSLSHRIEERGVRVTVGELPEIVVDKLSLEQIIGNLLDNAVKYLEPGRNGEIEITAERGMDEHTFRLRDNGRGIAKDDMSKVFELFRRAGKQDVPGEGMGLAYVKTLVRRHGGRIWCESEEGVGTTFTFTIPRKPIIT